MRILVPVRRPQTRWKVIIPIYDGRECPDCGAICCGDAAVSRHERWHVDTINWEDRVTEWQRKLTSSLAALFRKSGLGVTFEGPDEDDEDDDDDDDRLAAKAGRVARNPEYDDDKDETA